MVKAFNDGEIPFCFKALLTVEETAHYTGIGLNKLRVILADNPELSLWNGNRRMVKREKFEKFLENTYTL
ncbi:MAG: helix-turn-helix domain-containing protein [Clostridiales bacterium]|nr:helix-turn-helix domain-containing protein [Clostridiales bacterium]MBR3241237.1 helix-turn-helix domain-containing protein [Parasporobacterium sp.]